MNFSCLLGRTIGLFKLAKETEARGDGKEGMWELQKGKTALITASLTAGGENSTLLKRQRIKR